MFQANINLDNDQVVDLFAAAVGGTPSASLTGQHRTFVQNNGSQPVYLGSSDVTAGGGFKLIATADFSVELSKEHLYAAANSSGATNITILIVLE